ncbi:unnamed protein product [Prorocentrum cordatum]|uniref:PDZ domain-containing protein n=1 Tax=Prorocentrum cordatum TaxID=2364126 RepID=A0ABN9UHN7_9DINO|nr:unnamed protein product [Polarella glacialis]
MVPFRLTVLLVTAAVPAVALKTEAGVALEALLDITIHRRGKSDGARTGTTEVESLGEGSDVSVTFSPQERAALHASKFEKEFVVDLDMSDAHKMSVGVVLNMDNDYEPVSITKIKKTGILEAWNRLHPDKAVLVGDEIMKVNDIMWHHNSGTFAKRIQGQFLASRRQVPGARNVLTLAIQRPRKITAHRFQSQREDLRSRLYSKEFVAEIPLKGVLPGASLNQAMGWKLNATVDWMPISIEKMRNTGLVSMYNKEHPDAKIVAGDEILQVNHIQWHHNAKIFVGRLEAQFTAARNSELVGTPSNENVLKLSIRRPRSVSDTPEEQVYTKQYSAQLALKDARPLGWHLNKSSEAEPIVVEKIRRGSLLDSYNKANPEAMVRVGDAILKVNDLLWSGNTKEFADRIDKEFDISRPHRGQTPSDKTLNLVMQRRLVQPIMKEWTVTLPAIEGQILGWQLSHSEEEFPLTVSKVRSNGVVYEHNQEHPESKILPGDVIVKVNSVLWRQDSSSFEKRLNEQYSKSKETGNISLFLRRPVGVKDAFAEDKGRPFSHEFYIRLPIVNGQMMGWHLSSDNETAPIKVESVRNVGAVHDWNENNPFTDIQVGDHIVKVNNVLWHGNAKQFLERVNLQLEVARKDKGKPFVTVLVQRPWPVTATLPEDAGAGEDVVGDGDDAETGVVG